MNDHLGLLQRQGPLLPENPDHYRDTKDPCPVFDGTQWHLFGSGGSSLVEEWKLLHATSPSLEGPWTRQEVPVLVGLEAGLLHVAAPGMTYDLEERVFHMFVQTEFMGLGGSIHHLISTDGHIFTLRDTPLSSLPGTSEAGVYDPHPAVIHGQKMLTYSGCAVVGRPDLYVAVSETNTWNGPWKRMGAILTHADVPHHNRLDASDYEWGLEGSQLIELAPDLCLLNAVCFLPEGRIGTRQRVFFAVAHQPTGPFVTLGPVLQPQGDGWEDGENGHAAGVIVDSQLHLFYQSRADHSEHNQWRYGHAVFDVAQLTMVARQALHEREATGAPFEVVNTVELPVPKLP